MERGGCERVQLTADGVLVAMGIVVNSVNICCV